MGWRSSPSDNEYFGFLWKCARSNFERTKSVPKISSDAICYMSVNRVSNFHYIYWNTVELSFVTDAKTHLIVHKYLTSRLAMHRTETITIFRQWVRWFKQSIKNIICFSAPSKIVQDGKRKKKYARVLWRPKKKPKKNPQKVPSRRASSR